MLKFGTRYYMPDLARWTQHDPVKGSPTDPMSLNPYGYVADDPINAVDPNGRQYADVHVSLRFVTLGLIAEAAEPRGDEEIHFYAGPGLGAGFGVLMADSGNVEGTGLIPCFGANAALLFGGGAGWCPGSGPYAEPGFGLELGVTAYWIL
jgi:hypothetical protein